MHLWWFLTMMFTLIFFSRDTHVSRKERKPTQSGYFKRYHFYELNFLKLLIHLKMCDQYILVRTHHCFPHRCWTTTRYDINTVLMPTRQSLRPMSMLSLGCNAFQHPELRKTEDASDRASLCRRTKKRSVPVSTMNRVTAVWIPSKILSSVQATVLGRRIKIDFVAGMK